MCYCVSSKSFLAAAAHTSRLINATNPCSTRWLMNSGSFSTSTQSSSASEASSFLLLEEIPPPPPPSPPDASSLSKALLDARICCFSSSSSSSSATSVHSCPRQDLFSLQYRRKGSQFDLSVANTFGWPMLVIGYALSSLEQEETW